MRIIEGRVRLAASDVANFLACSQHTCWTCCTCGVDPSADDYAAGFQNLLKRAEAHEMAVLQGVVDQGLRVADIASWLQHNLGSDASVEEAVRLRSLGQG